MQVYESNFNRLLKIVGDDLKKLPYYIRFESKGFMPLTFDRLTKKELFAQYAMTHWYESNGDLIPDPEMVIDIYPNHNFVEARSIMHPPPFNRIIEVYNEEKTMYSPSQKKSQNSFLGSWLKNIASQGFALTDIRF